MWHHTTSLSTTNRNGRGWQVEKTHDLVGQTEQVASAVAVRAKAHTAAAQEVAQTSGRQAEAVRDANALLPSVEAAAEQALGALRYVPVRDRFEGR